jgi:arabinose-5-phosphate isomerase
MSNIDIAKEVIETEILGLNQLKKNINEQFSFSVDAILNTPGKVIICGMGKSGIIGKKIAASFASTGTSSFFMHPGEAFHGDLGMVTSNDIFVAISNSGETDEVLKLLPFLKDNKNVIIAMTGNPLSTLAINAHIHLNVSVPQEACHLQLAPTSSTTAPLKFCSFPPRRLFRAKIIKQNI